MCYVTKMSKMYKTNEEKRHTWRQRIYTAIIFVSFIISLPAFVLCALLTRIMKKCWIKFLKSSFPHLEIVKKDSVRTLMDTHRNQAIINVLMIIKGVCDPTAIREILLRDLIEKRDIAGNLYFPKLRLGLHSCWGNYAWSNTHFNLDNHLVMGDPKYRARPITERNLQDYVSNIITKFLPINTPPWQIILINKIVASEPTYGILVRVHHILIEEEPNLNIGDFLLLKPESEQFIRPTQSSQDHHISSTNNESFELKSPLTDIFSSQKVLSKLYFRLNETFSNTWNEFIFKFDPVEAPQPSNYRPGIFHFMAILLIIFASVWKELKMNKETTTMKKYTSYIFDFKVAFHHELNRRNILWKDISRSILVTFNVKSIVLNIVRFVYWINLCLCFYIPKILYYEYLAIMTHSNNNGEIYRNATLAALKDYIYLLWSAGKEIFEICALIYTAPITLFQEVFLNNNEEEHQLQLTSTCGRKVVAWSPPVSRRYIKEISSHANISETEVLLTMATCCIKEYFLHSVVSIPNTVLTSIKTISYDSILSSVEHNMNCKKNTGMLFLQLPVGKSCSDHAYADTFAISSEIERVRQNQKTIYALSEWRSIISELFPSVIGRILMNYGSRRLAVAILEITEGCNNIRGEYRETRWGDSVQSLLCWRPPQGNISMSLTLQRYGDTVRLGVMTDALIAPQHNAPARYWVQAARRLHTNIPQGCPHIIEHHVNRTIDGCPHATEPHNPDAPPGTECPLVSEKHSRKSKKRSHTNDHEMKKESHDVSTSTFDYFKELESQTITDNIREIDKPKGTEEYVKILNEYSLGTSQFVFKTQIRSLEKTDKYLYTENTDEYVYTEK